MFSDPIPPSDSTPKPVKAGDWLEGETYYLHLQRMTKLAGDESQEQFQKAFLANDLDDPAMFVFMDTMYQMIQKEMQFQATRMKEAMKKQRASFEGKD